MPEPAANISVSPTMRSNEYVRPADASSMACSRTSSSTPGSMGSTTISPGSSRENETRPGPWATLSTNGIPASNRLAPPGVSITAMATPSSFHSITWCSKNTASPAPSSMSTTGTTVPST